MNCRSYRKALESKPGAGPSDPHRESCAECRLYAERFEQARALLAEPVADERDRRPGPGFAALVVASLPERPGPLAWASLRLLPVTGALALTLLAWCWLVTPSPAEVWAQAGETDVLAWISSEDG